ncbi:hypothetical protein [Vibrio cholerae]|uniref:hypothetical protein n=1 Tax=Vibrio cholerae TaxID=666 RepID=UPI002DA35647|nr:hypothetical protein [Vibrio cholerae]MEB5514747.1 hypothetical protein [Vibrio cholerae]
MAVFGLACEGPTDQITLENILMGVFEELDDDEIAHVQPRFDKSDDNAKRAAGNWIRLVEYLGAKRFEEDLAAHDYLIIQIDTDIAEEVHANIVIKDADDKRLPDEMIVENTVSRLVDAINTNDQNMFLNNEHKIIFAITINSLECWLINTFIDDDAKVCLHANNCFDDLKALLSEIGGYPHLKKKPKIYDRISKLYLDKPELIEVLARRDTSFNMFLTRLKEAELP